MATLTPGELLGVPKENNAQFLMQISAIFSANSSPAPTGAHSSGNGVTGDQDMDDAWDEEDGEDPTWEDVLPTRGRETRRDGGGSAVANRLANPPPLSAINDIVKNHVPYRSVVGVYFQPSNFSSITKEARSAATRQNQRLRPAQGK